MLKESPNIKLITEDDYLVALGRIEAGTATPEDYSLARAWAHRMDDEQARMIRKICELTSGIALERI